MLRERLGKELLYFDGGMGSLLQEAGLKPGGAWTAAGRTPGDMESAARGRNP